MDKAIVLKPRISEKTYALSEVRNTYTFEVPGDANKHVVARAVSAQFDVTVEKVAIMVVKGKTKRTVRKGGRPVNGKRSDMKKAYVTLKQGDSLPIFAAEEEAEEKSKKTAELAEKAVEKRAKKETK
jgi:large subunit ribosomal protein L23